MTWITRITLGFTSLLLATAVLAAQPALKLGVGLFQPDREKNDATYKPLANYLATQLGREIQLKTVDTWEGLSQVTGVRRNRYCADGALGLCAGQ